MRPARLPNLVAIAALAVACSLALSACGEKSEPTGPDVSPYPVSVRDARSDVVSLESEPQLIAVAGDAPVQIAEALSLPVTRVDDGSGNLDSRRLRRIDAQLLLAGSDVDPAAITRVKALHIAVYAVPDRTLDGIERALTDVSLLAGVPLRGRSERASVARVRREVGAAVAGAEPVRVFYNAGHFATVSDSSFVGSLIAEARGENVAGDSNEGPFPLKRLAELRPEVILIASNLPLTLSDLEHNRLTRNLPAVRSGRVVRIDTRLLEPGPDAAFGLRRLAKAFHPDAFS